MPRIVGRPLLGDTFLPLGRGRVGTLEGELERADQPAELAEPPLAEAEVFLVDDVDLAAPDDRGLVDRLQVVLAEVGLEGDVDRLGQVLQRRLDADLPRVDLHGHVAQSARLARRDRPAVTRTRRDRHADGDVRRPGAGDGLRRDGSGGGAVGAGLAGRCRRRLEAAAKRLRPGGSSGLGGRIGHGSAPWLGDGEALGPS